MSLDITLLRLINSLVGRSTLLDTAARLLVNEYFVTTTLALILLILWFAPGDRTRQALFQRAFLETTLTVLLANVVLKAINLLYFRPRPFTALDVSLCFYKPSDSSLPSNPATVGFAIATAVYLRHRQAGTAMYALATLFALSRVYCGVHYPLDVISGALLGSLTALVVVRWSRLLEPIWVRLIGIARWLYLA